MIIRDLEGPTERMKRDLSSIQLKTPIVEREETGVRDTTTSAISGGVFTAMPGVQLHRKLSKSDSAAELQTPSPGWRAFTNIVAELAGLP